MNIKFTIKVNTAVRVRNHMNSRKVFLYSNTIKLIEEEGHISLYEMMTNAFIFWSAQPELDGKINEYLDLTRYGQIITEG